jgi:hypothetical protein
VTSELSNDFMTEESTFRIHASVDSELRGKVKVGAFDNDAEKTMQNEIFDTEK